MMDESRQAIAEANRRRYEELRAAGQQLTPKGLPEPTRRDGAPIADDSVIERRPVPGGWYTTVRLSRGEALRIIDDSGCASVSLIAWRREDTSERINCADTVKVQWSAALSKGRVILSDMGHVMLSVIEDTSSAHDLMVGGSTAASAFERFATETRNTRENFIAAAAKAGLGVRDIPPCVTFFAPVTTDEAGRLVWRAGRKQAGDFVDLRAEMNLIVVVSNCAHPLDPNGVPVPEAVTLIRHCAPVAAANDTCRTASPEAARAFAVTDQLFA
jgi:urea carboxylase-associated protein 2